MSEEKLPKGWKNCLVGDLFSFKGGGTPSKSNANYWNGAIPWASIKDISRVDILRSTIDSISEEGLANSSSNLASIGDLIMGIRMTVGKVVITEIETAINQDLKIIKGNLPNKFSFYWFSHLRQEIEKLSSGTTVKGITLEKLKSLPFPVPPLPEQQRIVAKLDAVFGLLDRVREKLDRLPELLKNFRQQVLTQAVTGELTREWREGKDLGEWEENLKAFLKERETDFLNSLKNKPSKIRKPEYLNYPLTDLKRAAIQGWLKGPIGLICDSIVPGRDKPKSFTGEIPWVTMPLLKNEIIDKNDAELFLTEEEIHEAKAKVIPEGSVVMSIVGRFGIASILDCDAVINQQLHAFLPSPIMSSKFLLYQILTSERYLNDVSTSTTVAYINKTNANSLPVNIPPIEEQEEIVKRVDVLFGFADKIESQYQSLKAKIDQMPQAVLAKAFRGELVGQEVKEYVREIGELGMVAEGDHFFNKK